MTSQRTQRPPTGSPVARLALLLFCLFAAGGVAATAQVPLTVKVKVVDEHDVPLKAGKVTIKRTDNVGTAKEEFIQGGQALVKGEFLTSKVYGVTVDAGEEYKQDPAPYIIPAEVLSAAPAGGEVALPQPIKMTSVPKSGGTPEPTATPADAQSAELKQQSQQLLAQLRQRPELLDQLLAEIAQEQLPQQQEQQQQAQQGAERKQPVLRERLVRYLQANPQLLPEVTPTYPLPKYWWVFALLLVLVTGGVIWLFAREVKNFFRDFSEQAQSNKTIIDKLEKGFSSLQKGQASVLNAVEQARVGAQQPETKEVVQLEPLPSASSGAAAGDSPSAPTTRDFAADAPPRAPEVRAREYFRNLVSNQQSVQEQRYLELDDSVRSSPTSMVQRGKVSLQEVSHPGVFVLYADDGGEGWVFPNPHRNYSKPALEMLFPDLDGEQFNTSKDTIHPVRVVRDGDRWRVEAAG